MPAGVAPGEGMAGLARTDRSASPSRIEDELCVTHLSIVRHNNSLRVIDLPELFV